MHDRFVCAGILRVILHDPRSSPDYLAVGFAEEEAFAGEGKGYVDCFDLCAEVAEERAEMWLRGGVGGIPEKAVGVVGGVVVAEDGE